MRVLAILIAMLPSLAWSEPLRVVTDIPPVHSLVSKIMEDRGEVTLLLEKNADPHHFQLRPSQSRAIARADILIWIGEELTPWLARARDGFAVDVPSLAFFEPEDAEGDSGNNTGDDHGHGHDGEDPHIWLNVHKAEEMLREIAEHLSELDSEGAQFYDANMIKAIAGLEMLEQDVEAALEGSHDVPFVVGHDAYGHFIEQFDLTLAGSLTDIHDSSASAQHISELARLAQNGGVKCVFPEVGESVKLANVLVDEGALLGDPLDPEGVSMTPGPELYDDLMLNLANSLSNCLRY